MDPDSLFLKLNIQKKYNFHILDESYPPFKEEFSFVEIFLSKENENEKKKSALKMEACKK
jgi:hypothetical protein